MIYLLDTNACIVYMNGRAPKLKGRLDQCQPFDVAVCAIVKAEMFYGAMKSQNPQRTLEKQQAFLAPFLSLPFDDNSAKVYADLRKNLELAGTPIGGNDMMIAAIAIRNGLTLVTHNSREFGRISSLKLEDWETGVTP